MKPNRPMVLYMNHGSCTNLFRFNGTCIHTDGLIRKTVPMLFRRYLPSPTTHLFFGGSTTFGFHVADEETCFNFVQLLQQNKENSYGGELWHPTYYGYRGLMLFYPAPVSKPSATLAIFTDGLRISSAFNQYCTKIIPGLPIAAQKVFQWTSAGNPTFEGTTGICISIAGRVLL